jgi:hypothetical protein
MIDAFGGSAFRGFGIARLAETMLRTMGATTVHLIRESQFTGTLQQRQLGQTEPQYNDVQVGPALVQTESQPPAAMKINVTLSGRTVMKLAQAEGIADGMAWLMSSRGILHQDTLLRITDVKAEMFAGVEYLYRVKAEV